MRVFSQAQGAFMDRLFYAVLILLIGVVLALVCADMAVIVYHDLIHNLGAAK